jgi:hypothetical protein
MALHNVAVEMRLQGVQTINTFSVEDIGGGGPFASVAERCRDAWIDRIMPVLSSEIQVVNVTSRDIATGLETESTAARAGSSSDSPLPPNCGVQFTKVATPGRNGRMFIAGFTELGVDAQGRLTAAVKPLLATAFTNFLADLVADNLQMIIIYGPAGEFKKDVSSAKVADYIVVQNRRLRRAKGL